MAEYAVGDVHGCFSTLRRLLEKIRFDPAADRLLMVGDLVNGGPGSLETLRWAKGLGDRLVTVLGNHDVYLLGRAYAESRRKKRDTLDSVLSAPDRDELLDWLRSRPLFHRRRDFAVVHAGLLPDWDFQTAARFSEKISEFLRSDRIGSFLSELFREKRERRVGKRDDLFRAMQAMTMLRTCRGDGRMCLEFSGPPNEAPKGCRPWFEYPAKGRRGVVFFGHWAALGFRRTRNAVGLDSGCVWGHSLTACRLQDGAVFHQPNLE